MTIEEFIEGLCVAAQIGEIQDEQLAAIFVDEAMLRNLGERLHGDGGCGPHRACRERVAQVGVLDLQRAKQSLSDCADGD